ncbi:CZB domain-containing protein [Motiliproteus sediminis]|uniref:CZB domain-containing protein n=1 Tax=Motiliproteus sediminis TaxID=1468178 RepID=UPI001AEFB3BF|nr:CZB domain-containing protein [Motiliproteus sediminis]
MAATLTRNERNRALDMLLIARMQHTRWVAEVKENRIPQVEGDPTRCEFGRWLLGSQETLAGFDAFRALEQPHTALHDAYKRLLKNPANDAERQAVVDHSRELIDNIDQLENALNRARVEAD